MLGKEVEGEVTFPLDNLTCNSADRTMFGIKTDGRISAVHSKAHLRSLETFILFQFSRPPSIAMRIRMSLRPLLSALFLVQVVELFATSTGAASGRTPKRFLLSNKERGGLEAWVTNVGASLQSLMVTSCEDSKKKLDVVLGYDNLTLYQVSFPKFYENYAASIQTGGPEIRQSDHVLACFHPGCLAPCAYPIMACMHPLSKVMI